MQEHDKTEEGGPVLVFQNSDGYRVYRERVQYKGKVVAIKEWTVGPDGTKSNVFVTWP